MFQESDIKYWTFNSQSGNTLPWSDWQRLPRESDLVSIVIPVFNEHKLTERCVRALFAVGADVRFEVVCVDNGSDETTQKTLNELAQVFENFGVVRNDKNLNFSLGCNIGFGYTRGDMVVFLNNDTVVQPGWLDALAKRLTVGDCYGVQPQLRYPDGSLQCMGVVFSDKSTLGYPIYAGMRPDVCNASRPRHFKALTAACLGLKANDFIQAKGFDALFINGQEDVDLCLRLHKLTGKLGAYVPDSLVIHQESKTEGRFKRIDDNRRLFVQRWMGKIVADDEKYYQEDGFAVINWLSDSEHRALEYRVYLPILKPLGMIECANKAFAAGDYAQAAVLYSKLCFNGRPGFPGLEGNFAALRRYWLNSRKANSERLKVGICSWNLDHNAAGRAITLAEAYMPFSDVEIIGCLASHTNNKLWPPLSSLEVPCHYFLIEAGDKFIRQAFDLVVRHPFDCVHLSKPRMHNVIFGWLYQLIWGARVIMDVDDEELAFVNADSPLNFVSYSQEHGSWPSFQSLHDTEWTRLAVGMVDQFDAVTVSNAALQRRYGGMVIPHVRPLARFAPSEARKSVSRNEFGIPHDKRVFLFYGTPRAHKGVAETAQALARLAREDICYVIAGGEPDEYTREAVAQVKGLDIRWLGNQPYERAADVVAMADACVLLQSADSPVAQFQLPAKLIDALGMGLTVFAQVTPPLEDLARKGAFIPVTQDNLQERLQAWLASGDNTQAQRGRAVFEAELTVEAIAPIIRRLLAGSSIRSAGSLRWGGQLTRLFNGQLPVGVPVNHQHT